MTGTQKNTTVVKKLIAATIAPAVVVVGVGLAPSAEATTGGCSQGRCLIRLSKAETRNLANGGSVDDIIGMSRGNPVLVAALSTLVFGHRVIASQYANRGWCSAFTASIYPWENQGYQGYRC